MTEYREVTDPKVQSRVRSRYGNEISVLQALGFRQLAFKLELRGPFSALWSLPILPLMRKAGEVLIFPFPLRLAAAYVLFTHLDPPSIVSCMGLGVKFFTNFSDGALLISSTIPSHAAFHNPAFSRPSKSQIVRIPPCGTIEEAWISHKEQTKKMQTEGNTICNTSTFADYLSISEREDEDLRSRRLC